MVQIQEAGRTVFKFLKAFSFSFPLQLNKLVLDQIVQMTCQYDLILTILHLY